MKLNTTTETVQVIKHQFELTDDELREALADPAAFVKALKKSLNGQAPKKRKAARKAKAAVPNGRRAAKPARTAKCPDCGQTLAAHFLTLHRKRKHGLGRTTAPAQPPTTAPAVE